MSEKNQIYKNAPLVETIFEIRFPGELSIECNKDKFYGKIRETYPKILVPVLSEGKAPALEPYKFERNDGTGGIMLSIGKIAVYCKKYEGFGPFSEETMRVLNIFGELFTVQKLIRTGLRYINLIPFTKEKGIIPVANYLNVKIVLPKSVPSSFTNLSAIFVSETRKGHMTTRIESVVSSDKTKEALILDFDYAKKKSLVFNSIPEYLDESHRYTKRLFKELITSEYKKVMQGEVI